MLKHLPETGEKIRYDGWSFEIVDMDGRKIDKLIVARHSGSRRESSESRTLLSKDGQTGRLKSTD